MKLETMSDFFTARTEGYDEHMLDHVGGCREGYIKMAEIIPDGTTVLLDLGCGTGLELNEILNKHPEIEVTGIDLTQSMLDKLKEKHPDGKLNLICGDYFKVDFGRDHFDCAVSFETMHHFRPEHKTSLYKRIFESLRSGGCYIECDYMVGTQIEEDHYFRENDRLRRKQNISDDVYCHYDTPCSVETQISILKKAGFKSVEKVFQIENTVMLAALRL